MVIAIIAILAAMLLPALNGARSMAKSIQCLNNQRQTMMAQCMYANDANGLMVVNSPYGAYSEPFMTLLTHRKSNSGVLDVASPGYLKWDSLVCPGIPQALVEARKSSFMWWSTYGMWLHVGISRAEVLSAVGDIFGEHAYNPSDWNSVHMNTGKANAPGGTIVLADTLINAGASNAGKPYWSFFPSTSRDGAGIAIVHGGGRANCAFIDGHAKSMSPQDMNASAGKVTYYVNSSLTALTL